MSELPDDIRRLSPLQQAAFALKKTRAELDELKRSMSEPIAVIGMGCRFPGGADSPQSFWRLLHQGVDTVGQIPAERWDVDA
ncbi:MAG: beta-ketoacyl synthase N-terminal-like domain-containing protein, partial [Thermoanaerobaculia bacterium]